MLSIYGKKCLGLLRNRDKRFNRPMYFHIVCTREKNIDAIERKYYKKERLDVNKLICFHIV